MSCPGLPGPALPIIRAWPQKVQCVDFPDLSLMKQPIFLMTSNNVISYNKNIYKK